MTVRKSVSAAALLAGLLIASPAFAPSQSQSQSQSSAPAPRPDRGFGALLGELKTFTQKESPDEEATAGDDIAARVFGATPPWGDLAVQHYVNLVGRHLAAQVERTDVTWRFVVLDTPAINAMALPGGLVLVTRGLYQKLETEDELAGVLAHEIAHVNRRHQWKVLRQQKLVALAGQSISGGDKARTARLVADLGARLIARGLDKSAEYEADRDGVVIAARAGYDASGLIEVLSRLRQLKPGDGDTALLFATHPSPAQRIEALTASAPPDLEAAAVPSAASSRLHTVHQRPGG
jgi:predicted Zn-dependent protease